MRSWKVPPFLSGMSTRRSRGMPEDARGLRLRVDRDDEERVRAGRRVAFARPPVEAHDEDVDPVLRAALALASRPAGSCRRRSGSVSRLRREEERRRAVMITSARYAESDGEEDDRRADDGALAACGTVWRRLPRHRLTLARAYRPKIAHVKQSGADTSHQPSLRLTLMRGHSYDPHARGRMARDRKRVKILKKERRMPEIDCRRSCQAELPGPA